MLFVTGPLYSGKRAFSQKFGGRQICDVQNLAANATDLEKLADELTAYDVVIATEIGGGIVPAVWPACWPRGQAAWWKCSAACPRY